MTTDTETRSPMQEYQEKYEALDRARDAALRSALETLEWEMLDEAIKAWVKEYKPGAEYQERRFRTRFYCTVCYGEIPQMHEVRIRGGGYAHNVCEHLYQFDMAKLRKQIKAQQFEHDPEASWHYRSEPCPALTEGWPTMHPKRTVFEEPR